MNKLAPLHKPCGALNVCSFGFENLSFIATLKYTGQRLFSNHWVLYLGIQNGHKVWLVRHHGLMCQMELISPELLLMWHFGFWIPTIYHWLFLLSLFLYCSSSCRQIWSLVWSLVECNGPVTVTTCIVWPVSRENRGSRQICSFCVWAPIQVIFGKKSYYGYFQSSLKPSFVSDMLTIWVMVGRQTLSMSLSVDLPIWSNSQLLFFIPIISIRTLSCVSV